MTSTSPALSSRCKLCELVRLERIDKSRAETVVTLASRRTPRGAHRQDLAEVRGRELAIALEQERHDAADLGGGQRSELVGVFWCRQFGGVAGAKRPPLGGGLGPS